jgi:hypothetical protein
MDDLYTLDVAAWAERQANLLRRLARGEQIINDQPDWPHIAEEIEDVVASQRREIRNRLAVLSEHLLKWAYQSDQRSGSWRGSIVDARERIADVLEESSSLGAYPAEQLARSYAAGFAKAAAETGLAGLPATCPWTAEQVLDRQFWPDRR